jgi:hypothetical protein
MEFSNSGSITYDDNEILGDQIDHLDLPNRQTVAHSDDYLIKSQTDQTEPPERKQVCVQKTSNEDDVEGFGEVEEVKSVFVHKNPNYYVSNKTHKLYKMKADGSVDVQGWSKEDYAKEIGEGIIYTQVNDEPKRAVDFTPIELVLPKEPEPSTIIMGYAITELIMLRFLLFIVMVYLLVRQCHPLLQAATAVAVGGSDSTLKEGGCDCDA